MKTRIYNARILTMEENKGIFEGEVWIDGDTITYVGTAEENGAQSRNSWDQQIDAQKNLIMPGFKDAHTHSAMTFLRSHADDMKLDEWLNTRVFPAEAKLTPDDVYWLTKLAVMEYLTSGITSIFDMYMKRPAGAQAVKDCVCDLTDFLYQVDSCQTAAMESVGTVSQPDGTIRGKVVSSISSGAESISYSAGSTSDTYVMEAAKDKKVMDTLVYSMVRDGLSCVPDANGVNLLYAGEYPGKRGLWE